MVRIRGPAHRLLTELAASDRRPLVDELTVLLEKEAERRSNKVAPPDPLLAQGQSGPGDETG